MSRRVHAFAEGRVQGVFYRKHTKAEADKLGLTGWCKNLADTRVEVVAEGPRENLEKLVAWMRVGPKHAVVTGVATEWLDATGEFRAFAIDH